VESNGKPDNPLPSTSRTDNGTCVRCGGLMVPEYYMDLQDDTGQIGITGLRCTSCGEVIDPVIFQNRIDPTPDLSHGVKRRKYAQRIDHSESEGQGRSDQGQDRQAGD